MYIRFYFSIFIIFAVFALPAPMVKAEIFSDIALIGDDGKTIESNLPNEETITYKFYWIGIKFGKAHVIWKETDDKYEAIASAKASGIARMFDKQKRLLKVEGIKKKDENGVIQYIPKKSFYSVVRPKKKREVVITYNENGGVKEAIVTPPDNRKIRPDVAQEKKDTAFDILTTLLILHRNTLHGKKQFKVLVYDGRRLTEGVFTKAKMNDDDPDEWKNDDDAVKYSAHRVMKDGYTNKERRRYYKNTEPPIISITTPKTSRFPQYVYANSKYGTITGKRKD